MQVMANGEPVALPAGARLTDLFAALGLGAKWVVAELNGDAVDRADMASDAPGRRRPDRAGASSCRGLTASGLTGCGSICARADRPDLAAFLAACLRGGVDVVQLREKELDARPLLARAEVAAAVCAEFGVPFILNDRPDLALACEADGVHVGQDDTPPALARRILGPDADHRLVHPRPSRVGRRRRPNRRLPVGRAGQPTPTKPGRPGTGLEYVAYAAASARRGRGS